MESLGEAQCRRRAGRAAGVLEELLVSLHGSGSQLKATHHPNIIREQTKPPDFRQTKVKGSQETSF